MLTSVYWIRHKDHDDIFSQGYVGVSKNHEVRWKQHKSKINKKVHDNAHFAAAVEKYGWDALVKEVVVFAEKDYCYEIENKLRPKEQTGWNIAPGGNKPPTTKPHGKDYISPLKGVSRDTPWMLGRKPWNVGQKYEFSEKHKAYYLAAISKPHTEEHIKKRQDSRRATRIAKGHIRAVVINGIEYEDVNLAAKAIHVPESTIKYWLKNGFTTKKHTHITECRWA